MKLLSPTDVVTMPILELAVAVQGFMALGIACILGGFFTNRRMHWHRVPVTVAVFGIIALTLESLISGCYSHTAWRVYALGGLYSLLMVGMYLITAKVAKDVE